MTEGLTHRETVVLAGVLRVLMMADGELSQEELSFVDGLARSLEISVQEWNEIWEEAARALPNEEDVKEAAAEIDRAKAQELIYEYLYELGRADKLVDAEWDLLEWLDETWHASK